MHIFKTVWEIERTFNILMGVSQAYIIFSDLRSFINAMKNKCYNPNKKTFPFFIWRFLGHWKWL